MADDLTRDEAVACALAPRSAKDNGASDDRRVKAFTARLNNMGYEVLPTVLVDALMTAAGTT